MENLIKTLYFDYKLISAFSFKDWLKITLSKYQCLFLVFLGKKDLNLDVITNTIRVSSIGDIGTVFSSLSDEYHDLYKVIGEELSIIIDVGANIGQFSNAVKTWYPKSEIHSFEPDPEVYQILKNNLKSSDYTLHNLALSDTKGSLKFYRSEGSLVSSIVKTSESQECIEVEAVTADSFLSDIHKIDLFKIDVEGAEINVLKGAHSTLKKSKYLLVEISFDRKVSEGSNLSVLSEVYSVCPNAEIIHLGRALGGGGKITAQDFLIKLNNT